jgi:small-conductance mechanosensitive channel
MEILMESLRQDWHGLLQILPRLGISLVIIVLFLWFGKLAGRGLARVLRRGDLTGTHVSFFRIVVQWTLTIVGVIVALNLMGLRGLAAGLLAGGGITAVVLGFAFRGIGENFLAGFFLAFSRPFNVGDLIQSRELMGVVKGIELRYTHVRTADGRDIFIPSAQIFSDPLVNFTRDGLRRPSFTVGIDYANDSQLARQLLLDTVRGVDGVLKDPQPIATISSFTQDYVELEVCFWIDTFRRDINLVQIRTEAMERCRRVLLDHAFTVSSNVSTNLEGAAGEPFMIRWIPGGPVAGETRT